MSHIRRLTFALLGFLFFTPHLVAQSADSVPPQVKCKPNPVVNAGTGICEGNIYLSDLMESVADNSSPTNSILLGVRKKCTGEGFPQGKTYLTFGITELGLAEVEVWAKDEAGNTSSCTAQVIVTDNIGSCDPIHGCQVFFAKNDALIKDAGVSVKRFPCSGDSSIENFTSEDFRASSFGLPGDLLLAVPFLNDDPLNGVTTYDLTLIVKHILGLSKLSTVQLIAADANRDGKVTMYDVVLIRNLILGVIPELPGGLSWRFWPYDYSFPDPDNPFSPPFPERIEVPRSADPVPNRFQFFGVKIGDVDFSAKVN